MRVLWPALLIATSVSVQPASVRAQDIPRDDAYLDDAARELVRLARARRVTLDRRIDGYRATAVERISVGLGTGIVDRLLYRRETASRIDWKRNGPVNIEVVGAREVVPPFNPAPAVPGDLAQYVPHLAFDPVDSEMLVRFDTTVIRHPLAAGSEAHYRFATGDSTVITLPDGRAIRLRELRIMPRRRDPHLINGSFWLDAESHAVVQSYFRLARPFRAGGRGGVRPNLVQGSGDIEYFAIDYGLWNLHWWLPRAVVARGVLQVGPVRMPLRYERRYDDYVITGDTLAPPPVPGEAPVVETRPCRPPVRMSVNVSMPGTPPDTTTERARRARARQAARDSARAERRRAAGEADSTRICDREFNTTTRAASELLDSPLLPASIYDDDTVVTAAELAAIAERARRIAEPPWQLSAPVVRWGPGAPGLVRYNRIEGLSIGVGAALDLGRIEIDAEARFGTADRDLAGELGLTRSGRVASTRLAAYHRLDASDITTGPFSVGSTLNALLLGSNDDNYFRTTGAELGIAPAATRTQWYELRVFAERQRSVAKNTDFSLVHVIDGDHVFRDNRPSDAADQLGARLRLRGSHGIDPTLPTLAAELELHGETGDYDMLRPRLRLRAELPLLRRFTMGGEVEGGTSFGSPTAQRFWQIGGARTIRGYSAATLVGETFWRTRAELGLGWPAVRLALFGDAAWAGARDDFERSRPIRSAGVGLSFMDGMFRLDIARALDRPVGWKLHLLTNGIL